MRNFNRRSNASWRPRSESDHGSISKKPGTRILRPAIADKPGTIEDQETNTRLSIILLHSLSRGQIIIFIKNLFAILQLNAQMPRQKLGE